jgi:hypothetical protein
MDQASEAPIRQLVVVPRVPGPLRRLDDDPDGERDEIAQAIDEVFGPSTDEGPGLFDALLILVGIALVAWSWLSEGTGPWFGIGITAIVLGVALPARSLLRAARSRRIARREARVLRAGRALDTSDASVGTLAGSYDALLHAAALPGTSAGPGAIAAGHAALLEVVSLLHGRPPLTEEELAYVDRRTEAVRDLTVALVAANRRWHRIVLQDWEDSTADARRRAAAVVRAREELESKTGVGAVEELQRLEAELRSRADGDGA